MKPEFARALQNLLPAIAAAALLAALPAWPQEAEDTGAAPEAAAEPDATEAGEAAEPSGTTEAGSEAPETAADSGAGDPAGGAEAGAEAGGETEAAGEGGPLVVEAEEGSVLDDQTFEGEDDGFTPSEEIPVDEPIPFPTDI